MVSLSGFAMVCDPLHASTRGPPTRIANIYDGFDHQPSQSQVERHEQAAGIDLNRSQQERDAATVNELYQELEGKPTNQRDLR